MTRQEIEDLVRRDALSCGIPEVEDWARKWLDGSDRSEAAADAASDVAAAAADAAWSSALAAARAARIAAWEDV